MVPLLMGIVFIPCTLLYLYKMEYFMSYYTISNLIVAINVVLILTFAGIKGEANDYYLLLAILVLICTQAIEINFVVVMVSLGVILITNVVFEATDRFVNTSVVASIAQVVCTLLIVAANLLTLKKCQISSKTNFIINESFEN